MNCQISNETSPKESAERERIIRRLTWIGLALNLLLSGIKALIGVIAQSRSLVADAIHSLSDSVTDLAILIGSHFWSAPPDREHPYGHGRIETAVSLAIGLALAVVGCSFFFTGLEHLREPTPAPGWSALIAALLSILVKELLYRWTIHVGRAVHSESLIANAWHHRSDAVSSIPVALSVLGSHLFPNFQSLDAIATLFVAFFILKAAWDLVFPALNNLIDRSASEELCKQVTEMALQTEGVRSIHALRSRHVGPGYQVDLHVMVDPDLTVREGHEIAATVKHLILDREPSILEVLIHIEPWENEQADQNEAFEAQKS